jgi:hypothetical protein
VAVSYKEKKVVPLVNAVLANVDKNMLNEYQVKRSEELAKESTKEALNAGRINSNQTSSYEELAKRSWERNFERNNEYNKADSHIN